ncbi:MAG: hypothetical protein D6683_13810 [Actinomyces sp.]|nr:MAG: hypothetical protein D6683_13810 [Actinomyces sp.]
MSVPVALTIARLRLVRLVLAVRHGIVARGEGGQATAEYALVVIAAATIGLLVLKWAAGTDGVTVLMNRVLESVTSKIA